MFLACGAVLSWSQPGQLPETPDIVDPVLRRQRDIHEIVNRIKEELTVNRDAKAAKALCNRVLAIDPKNPEALLYLSLAESQLKNKGTATTRSAVSLLPDASTMKDALQPSGSRSRPTTPTIAGARQSESPTESRPGSSWLDRKYTKWILLGLLGVVCVPVLLMLYDRLSAGRRSRAAQEDLFKHMRAAAEAAQEQSTVEPGPLDEPPLDDFPVGVPVAPGPPEASPLSTPTSGGLNDEVVDYWDQEPEKDGPAAAAAIAAEASTGPPSESRDAPADRMMYQDSTPEPESDAISAESVFADEGLDFGVDSSSPAPETGTVPHTFAPSTPVADDQPPAAPFFGSSPGTAAIEDDEIEPIMMEGIDVDAPAITGAPEQEADLTEKRELRPDQSSLDDLQFDESPPAQEDESRRFSLDASFDAPLGETQTITQGEDFPLTTDEPSLEVVAEDPSTMNQPDDRPVLPDVGEPAELALGETGDLVLDDGLDEGESSEPEISLSSPQGDSDEVNDETFHDEILIATGRRPGDQTAALAGQEIGKDSTMIDSRARHKAIYQDQLARGLSAMEKGYFKDAVKFLSVAHAMDPTNDYAREKLREAREKRNQEAT